MASRRSLFPDWSCAPSYRRDLAEVKPCPSTPHQPLPLEGAREPDAAVGHLGRAEDVDARVPGADGGAAEAGREPTRWTGLAGPLAHFRGGDLGRRFLDVHRLQE